MNFGRAFLSMMTLIRSLPGHLWISALAFFGVVQRFRLGLERAHQKDQFRPTDHGVCEYSLSMNSVAPLEVGARSEILRKRPGLRHFGNILTLYFSTYTQHQNAERRQREMVELPVGSKPGWELEQPDTDQEESPPLKSVADRSAFFVLALFTCPWLTHWLAFSFSIH